MKLKILYTVLAFLAAHLITSQVLYSENFDNLIDGNIGTDPTGQTAGQGDWHTRSYDQSNDYFKIVAEPGRGKVMELITPQSQYIDHNELQKRGIDVLWNTRISGNDILKIEYDFFTGPYANGGVYALYMSKQ